MKSNRSCAVGIAIGITVLCLASAAIAEDPYEVAWISQIGTNEGDFGESVAVDASGNVYVCGYTYGDLAGANAGEIDAFLRKSDSDGNELWTRQVGTSGDDISYAVAVDASNDVYITGMTTGNLAGTNNGGKDIFLSKFDSSGSSLWTTQVGTDVNENSLGVAADMLGNSYICGYTLGDLSGPGSGTVDAYLSKFDSSGGEVWTTQIDSGGGDWCQSIAVDVAGNAYITGYTNGDLDGANAGVHDVFLSKFNDSGEEAWTTQVGTNSWDLSFAVAVDSSGNIYITGGTEGDFDGQNAGNYDVFLSKFSNLGEELWTTQVGTFAHEEGRALAVDALGNAYVSGSISSGTTQSGDAFLMKFDSLGNEVWTSRVGSDDGDFSYSVALDAEGDVYMSGFTGGDLGGPSFGTSDAFLVKFDPLIVPEPATVSLLALGGVALLRRKRSA